MSERTTSKEKQIEEMAEAIFQHCQCGLFFSEAERIADFVINQQGDRKQSGWISVEERLPERNGRYLTHCKIEGQSLVCILYYCNVGGFDEETVTHWMPLPEPPMMKGGAE